MCYALASLSFWPLLSALFFVLVPCRSCLSHFSILSKSHSLHRIHPSNRCCLFRYSLYNCWCLQRISSLRPFEFPLALMCSLRISIVFLNYVLCLLCIYLLCSIVTSLPVLISYSVLSSLLLFLFSSFDLLLRSLGFFGSCLSQLPL